jgi:hypothetical protein
MSPIVNSDNSRSLKGFIFQEKKSAFFKSGLSARYCLFNGNKSIKLSRAINFFNENPNGNYHEFRLLSKDTSETKTVFLDSAEFQIVTGATAKSSGVSSQGLGFAGSLWDLSSNFSAILRNAFWIENRINPDIGITQGIGYTSAVSLFTGPIRIKEAKQTYKTAKKINDYIGKFLSVFSGVRGAMDLLIGASMAGVRTINLIAASNSSKAVALASSVFGYLSTTLASSLFLIHLGRSLRSFVKAFRALNELNKKSTYDEALLSLTSLLNLDNPEIALGHLESYEKLKKLMKTPKVSDEDKALLTKAEMESGSLTGFEGSDAKGIENIGEIKENYRLSELVKIKKRKMAEFERVYGRESLNLLMKALSEGVARDATQQTEITLGLEVSSKDVQKLTPEHLVNSVKAELRKKVLLEALVVIGSIIGVVSFIMTTIYTGGANLLAGYILMMAMNLILSAIDTKDLINRLKNMEKIDTKQKVLLSLFTITTLAISVVGCIFAGDTQMFKMALTASVIMISMQLSGALYAWKFSKSSTENSKRGILSNRDLISLDDSSSEGSQSIFTVQPRESPYGRENRFLCRRVSAISSGRKRVKPKHSKRVQNRSSNPTERGRAPERQPRRASKRSHAHSRASG